MGRWSVLQGVSALLPALTEGPSRFQVRNPGRGQLIPVTKEGRGSWHGTPAPLTSRSPSLGPAAPWQWARRGLCLGCQGPWWGAFCGPVVHPVLGMPVARGLASGSLRGHPLGDCRTHTQEPSAQPADTPPSPGPGVSDGKDSVGPLPPSLAQGWVQEMLINAPPMRHWRHREGSRLAQGHTARPV